MCLNIHGKLLKLLQEQFHLVVYKTLYISKNNVFFCFQDSLSVLKIRKRLLTLIK